MAVDGHMPLPKHILLHPEQPSHSWKQHMSRRRDMHTKLQPVHCQYCCTRLMMLIAVKRVNQNRSTNGVWIELRSLHNFNTGLAILGLEQLMLVYVRSLRDSKFSLYVAVLTKLATLFFALDHTLLKIGTNSHPWHDDFAGATSWYNNPVFSGRICCSQNKAAILFNRDRSSIWTEQQSRKRRWWGSRFVAKPKSSIALDRGGTGNCEGYWRVWGQMAGWRCRENHQDQSQAPWANCVCTSQLCHWGWCSRSSTWTYGKSIHGREWRPGSW